MKYLNSRKSLAKMLEKDGVYKMMTRAEFIKCIMQKDYGKLENDWIFSKPKKIKWVGEFAPNLGHDPNNPFPFKTKPESCEVFNRVVPLDKSKIEKIVEHINISQNTARLEKKINELVERVNFLSTNEEKKK